MLNNKRKQLFAFFISLSWSVFIFTSPLMAGSDIKLSKGQVIYVPVYSHIYHGDREQPFYLAVTLSVRNTDPDHPITIISVDYNDTDGKLVKRYAEKSIQLGAMASTHYIVKESDKTGGAGANFIVKWKSDTKVVEPIVESIMISTQTQQGVSFTSRGRAIKEDYE